jgi:hypothetical protein
VNDEEPSKEQDDLLFDRRPPKSSLRPQSAKASEYKDAQRSKTRKGPRPISANKPIAARTRPSAFRKEQDLTFLARLKPRHIPQDKERLYEESLALKVKINNLNEDNLRLKTRINQLEREITKRDDLISDLKTASLVDRPGISNIKSLHLVTNLKNSVRELRQDIKARDEEIATLRKNIKSTKLSEMEVEIQAYIDECTRLRHHLEEVMRQRDQPQSSPGFNGIEEKHYQQTLLLNNLRKENQELSSALNQAHDELDGMKSRILELEKEAKKKRPKRKTSDLGNFKTEIQKLKTQLEASREESKKKDQAIESLNLQLRKAGPDKDIQLQQAEAQIRNLNATIEALKQHTAQTTPVSSFPARNVEQKKEPSQRPQSAKKLEKPPKLLKKLHHAAKTRNMLISILLSILDKRNSRVLSPIEIIQGLDQFGIKIKKEDIEKSIETLTGKKQNTIRVDLLEQLYDKYQYKDGDISSSSSDEELQEEEKVPPPVQVPNKLPSQPSIPSQSQNTLASQNPPAAQNPSSRPQTANKSSQERSSSIRQDQAKPLDLAPIKEEAKKESPPKPSPEEARIPKIREEEVKETLTHISLRLQLHRVPKSKFTSALFGNMDKEKEVGMHELVQIFTKPPLSFEKGEQVNKLCRFLLESEQGDTIKASEKDTLKSPLKSVIGKLFRSLADWEIFTPKDEEGFDRHLGTIISKNKITLKQACKIYDNEDSGIITVHEFMEVIEDLDVSFPPPILNYMMLLFYSHKYELNSVPYKHFIKAYGNPQDEYNPEESGFEDSQDEEERAKVVRHYLGIIAQSLNANKMYVRDVFSADNKGLIYPDKFIKGVQKLRLEIEEEHIVIILEALQYEEEENKVCMRLDELEEILVHYGVPLGEREYESDKSSKYGSRKSSSDLPRFSDSDRSGHVKKVSLLDSPENFDYSEDSPDRVTKGKYSPRLSESSPFGSMSGDINRGSSLKSLNKNLSRDRFKDSKESTLSKKNQSSSRKSSRSNTGNFRQEIAEVMKKETPQLNKRKSGSYSGDEGKFPPRSPTPTPPPKVSASKGPAIRVEAEVVINNTVSKHSSSRSSSSSDHESPKPHNKSISSSVSSDYGLREEIMKKSPSPPPQPQRRQRTPSESSSSVDSDYIAGLVKKKEASNRSFKRSSSRSSASEKSYIESEESPVPLRHHSNKFIESKSSSEDEYQAPKAEKVVIPLMKPRSKSNSSVSEDEYKEEFEDSDVEGQAYKLKSESKFRSSSDSYDNEFGSGPISPKDMLNKVTNLKGISPIKGKKHKFGSVSSRSSSSSSGSFKKQAPKKTKQIKKKSSSSSDSEQYSIDDIQSSVEEYDD